MGANCSKRKYAMPDAVEIIIGHDDPISVLRSVRPNLLQVCQESRVEALKRYKLFDVPLFDVPLFDGFGGKLPIFMDLEQDEICLLTKKMQESRNNGNDRLVMNRLAKKVQRLALPELHDMIIPSWPDLQGWHWVLQGVRYLGQIYTHAIPRLVINYGSIHQKISFPGLKQIIFIMGQEEGGEFMRILASRAIYDKTPSEHLQNYQEASVSRYGQFDNLMFGSEMLPLHGTDPTILVRQTWLHYYMGYPDWQPEYARYWLCCLKARFLRIIENFRRHIPGGKIGSLLLSVRYPGKGVEYDVVNSGSWSALGGKPDYTIMNRARYTLPELKLRYPDGHKMSEITETIPI